MIFLLGPTAVGKTAFSLEAAKKLNAEIISCDSMQVYKGMDIISSKPSPAARKKIPHHLIEIIPPEKEFNAALYRGCALAAIKQILKRKKTPLFVGGSGLYAAAVLDGVFRGPGEDKLMRKKLYNQSRQKGKNYLYQRLQQFDPEAAAKIHPNDLKRVVRALEVYLKTNKPISCWQKQRQGITHRYAIKIYCLQRERNELYTRINQRVEAMFKKGLVSEVKCLLKKRLSKTASYAIGIAEIKDYLEGKHTLQEAKELIKQHSRQYAKRQLTWFRKDKRIKWLTENKWKSAF